MSSLKTGLKIGASVILAALAAWFIGNCHSKNLNKKLDKPVTFQIYDINVLEKQKLEDANCEGDKTFSGTKAKELHQTINLGTDTGEVDFYADGYTRPDWFRVYYDGKKVIDTGFIGDDRLASKIHELGFETEEFMPHSAFEKFSKPTKYPTTAEVVVVAPMDDTYFTYNMYCPATPVPTRTDEERQSYNYNNYVPSEHTPIPEPSLQDKLNEEKGLSNKLKP